MKKMILLVSLLVSSFVFAGVNADSTWSQIRKAGYDFDMPKYWVGGNTNVPASEVCQTADAIRTLTERAVCVEHQYVGGDEGWICSKVENQYLYGKKFITQTLCREFGGSDGNCIDEYEVTIDLALSHDINVYKIIGRTGDGDVIRASVAAFTKKLDVPACL